MPSDGLEFVIRRAQPGDAGVAADLADAKRAEYEPFSPVFWHRAPGARDHHLPFLRQCIKSDRFAAFTAQSGDEIAGVILAKRGAAPPPFHADPTPTSFVDDFFVAHSKQWSTVGAALLDTVGADARSHGSKRIVVVTAQRDIPKRTMLLDAGYTLTAAWWVRPTRPIDPANDGVAPLSAVEAVVAPAPPVYDPGGPVALALSTATSTVLDVALFEQRAAAAGAVLAIVPAPTTNTAFAAQLEANGYTVASEWFTRHL